MMLIDLIAGRKHGLSNPGDEPHLLRRCGCDESEEIFDRGVGAVRRSQEERWVDSEGAGHGLESLHRWGPLPSFHLPDVAGVQASELSELFLRKMLHTPEFPDPAAR